MSLEAAFNLGLKPDPILSVSEWADEYRVLSQKSSAEPGRWRTSRTPYLREIMDCLSVTSPVERVVFMKGAQVGGSETGNNWLGYIVDYIPGPTMAVQPTVELAKRYSKQRIAPFIEASDRLKKKISDARSRDGGNTVLTKEFPGGLLVITGANSAVGLRSLPARFLFLDEIDAYPDDVDGEGSPIDLVFARTRTFAGKRKVFLCSTPTTEGHSKIEAEYENSDKRRYHLPCPHCDEYQWLKWSQVKWDKEPLDAWYECEHCDARVENWQKTDMLKRGKWVAENPGISKGTIAGFHLSSLYSPVGWASWGDLAKEWVDANDTKTGNKREKLRAFINTVLGETWKDKGEAPDWKILHERKKHYKINTVPAGVIFLTAGVDIQKGRIEAEIKGWGRDKKSWSIDYRVFDGDTDTMNSPAWKALTALLGEVWPAPNGTDMEIKRMAVDSGYNTQTVYSWCRQFPITKVFAIKGNESGSVMVGVATPVDVNFRGRKMRKGARVFPIGVNLIKTETYGFLKQSTPDEGQEPSYGFCSFPEYGEEYFKMLTAEEMTIKIVRGFKRYIWEKIRDRNEALDCHVYNRAAASVYGMDRFKEPNWLKLEQDIGVVYQKEMGQTKVNNEKKTKPPIIIIKRRKSTFL